MQKYIVFHYRGTRMGVFDTQVEAEAFIAGQKIPTEYYWERGAKE
jgi:hypothetical protein